MLIDFREKGIREGKREGEKHQCEEHPLVAPCMHPDEGLNLNLGLCPDQELNLWPFGLWNDAPTKWTTLAREMQDIAISPKSFLISLTVIPFLTSGLGQPLICFGFFCLFVLFCFVASLDQFTFFRTSITDSYSLYCFVSGFCHSVWWYWIMSVVEFISRSYYIA